MLLVVVPHYCNEVIKNKSYHSSVASDSIINGKVVGIADGDTFTLLLKDSTTIKVRVASIDCPERKQPFSKRAKQFTSDAIFGKQVRIEVKSKDRYRRYIADVYYKNRNLAKELLKNGLAWHFVEYSDDPKLDKLEKKARAKKRGLWAEKDPIPPWKWRKGERVSAN